MLPELRRAWTHGFLPRLPARRERHGLKTEILKAHRLAQGSAGDCAGAAATPNRQLPARLPKAVEAAHAALAPRAGTEPRFSRPGSWQLAGRLAVCWDVTSQ